MVLMTPCVCRAQVGNNIPIFFIRCAARGPQLLAAHYARAVRQKSTCSCQREDCKQVHITSPMLEAALSAECVRALRRDGYQFPDLVHALRPNPKTHIQEGWRILDFLSSKPESCAMARPRLAV